LPSFEFELAPRLYEHIGRNAKLLGNVKKVGLVRLKETQKSGEDRRFSDPVAKLICIDSGQVDEPLGASGVTKRCCKRCKRDSVRVDWRISKQCLHSADS
jgi:hypothetical protein